MSVAHVPLLTHDDALAAEEATGIKHEVVDGELWAMSGGTPEHNLIASNTLLRVGMALLGKPCRVYNPDQLVHVHDDEDDASLYPDVAVYCGGGQRSPTVNRAFTNPIALFEVLSGSTESYDRNKKFALYRKLDSLRHYVLLAQDRVHAEVYDRNDDGTWTVHFLGPGQSLPLATLDVKLAVDDLYDGVFTEPDA